jgi:ATP-dependent DNA helicase RecG
LASFNIEDFLVLDLVHKERSIPSFPHELKIRRNHLVDLGVIERIGKGRGASYMLCRQYYVLAGKSGMYTRKRGLDRETSKELLLQHIWSNAETGSKFNELCQVLPSYSNDQIKQLLKDLKAASQIYVQGKTSASVWFPVLGV